MATGNDRRGAMAGINGDELPLGMRPGINHNLVAPSFRDEPREDARKRLWPLAASAVAALVVIAVLVGYSVLS